MVAKSVNEPMQILVTRIALRQRVSLILNRRLKMSRWPNVATATKAVISPDQSEFGCSFLIEIYEYCYDVYSDCT